MVTFTKYDTSCSIIIEGAEARIEGLVPWSVVIDATSYDSPGYRFNPRYKMGFWDGRIKLFRQSKRTFPAGLTQAVKEALEAIDIRVQIDDKRRRPPLPALTADWARGLELEGVSFAPPYDYQPVVAEAMLKAQRGVVAVATNGGKTELSCLVTSALRVPTLFMTPGKDLLYQTQKRFQKRLRLDSKSVGLVGGGKWDPGSWITIGTVQTLAEALKTARGKELLDKTQLIFADECFPRGTLVDGKPIEIIKEGDMVSSFDEITGKFCKQKVIKKFISRPTALVRIYFGKKSLIVTPGHPFWTQRGWVPAVTLTKNDVLLRFSSEKRFNDDCAMLSLQKIYKTNTRSRQRCVSYLQKIIEENSQNELYSVRSAGGTINDCAVNTSQKRTSLLLRNVQKIMDVKMLFRNNEEHELTFSRDNFLPYDTQKSYVRSKSKSKAKRNSQSNGVETSCTGRKWKRANSFGAIAVYGSEMAHKYHSQDREDKEFWLSDALQSRYSKQRLEYCDRDRWRISLLDRETKTRSKERIVSSWVRVDGVEVLKQGSDGTFGGMCPDGLVYNLEVEKTHTYTVEGVVVHNCHHVGADTWYQVLKSCNAFFRYGLSGTPLKRTDGADLRLLGATGPVIYEIRNKELIARGISSQVRIQFIKVLKPDLPKGTPYPDAYKYGIVENIYRNRKLCKIIEKHVDENKSVLVLVKEIPHGININKSLWDYCKFVPSQFICGKESMEIRQKALEDFKKGDLKVLISTSILDEGIDVPNIDVLVLAGGGKSSIKTLQRIGRGIRIGGNSEYLTVIDTADFQNPQYLLQHSKQRLQDYINEECFVIEQLDI